MAGSFQREGIYVYISLVHFAVQQKLTQHCKAVILRKKESMDGQLAIIKPMNLYLQTRAVAIENHSQFPTRLMVPGYDTSFLVIVGISILPVSGTKEALFCSQVWYSSQASL